MTRSPWTGTAAICVSGHVIQPTVSTEADEERIQMRCGTCGGDVLTRCPACDYQLAVDWHTPPGSTRHDNLRRPVIAARTAVNLTPG